MLTTSGASPRTDSSQPPVGSTTDRVPTNWAWAAGLAPLIFGGVIAVQAYGLSIGSLAHPGPGLWPFCLGVALCVCSLVLFGTRMTSVGCECIDEGGLVQVVSGIFAGAFFIGIFATLGVEMAGVLMLTGWFRFLAGCSWRFSVGCATTCSLAAYLIFAVALGVPFPTPF